MRHFSVRQMTSHDWAAYRDFHKGLKKPHHFRGYLEGRNLEARETYDNLFANTINREPKGSFVMFGVWDRDRLIGITSLDFSEQNGRKSVLLAGSQRADALRKMGIGDIFYRTRLNYLQQIGFGGDVSTSIGPENTDSIKAAERNGFTNTGLLDKQGYCIFAAPLQAERRMEVSAPRARPGRSG
jgi:RimJ/RimL family protein N-acetyltransferase